jgi:hypothetical protein
MKRFITAAAFASFLAMPAMAGQSLVGVGGGVEGAAPGRRRQPTPRMTASTGLGCWGI